MAPAARTQRVIAAAAAAAAIAASSMLLGCATTGASGGPQAGGPGAVAPHPVGSTPAAELERAIADHAAGRHDAAAGRAGALLGRTSGLLRDQAAYVAGVALLESGRLAESERMLSVARRSGDPALRARAEAATGLALEARGRDRAALDAFERAHDGLHGRDRVRAARAAERVAARQGDVRGRTRWAGRAEAADAAPDRDWRDGWAIQVGAFSARTSAETAAARAERRIDAAGLGGVRIIPRRGPGPRAELLYVVQFGAFSSEAAAEAARRRHGWAEWIVREAAG